MLLMQIYLSTKSKHSQDQPLSLLGSRSRFSCSNLKVNYTGKQSVRKLVTIDHNARASLSYLSSTRRTMSSRQKLLAKKVIHGQMV